METSPAELGGTSVDLLRYLEVFQAATAPEELTGRLGARIEAAHLLHEGGMAHRQALNSEVLGFLRAEAQALTTALGADFPMQQTLFYPLFIEGNRKEFYRTLSRQPAAEPLYDGYIDFALAKDRPLHQPETAIAKALWEVVQLAPPQKLPSHEREARIHAVKDSLIIYGMTGWAVLKMRYGQGSRALREDAFEDRPRRVY